MAEGGLKIVVLLLLSLSLSLSRCLSLCLPVSHFSALCWLSLSFLFIYRKRGAVVAVIFWFFYLSLSLCFRSVARWLSLFLISLCHPFLSHVAVFCCRCCGCQKGIVYRRIRVGARRGRERERKRENLFFPLSISLFLSLSLPFHASALAAAAQASALAAASWLTLAKLGRWVPHEAFSAPMLEYQRFRYVRKSSSL